MTRRTARTTSKSTSRRRSWRRWWAGRRLSAWRGCMARAPTGSPSAGSKPQVSEQGGAAATLSCPPLAPALVCVRCPLLDVLDAAAGQRNVIAFHTDRGSSKTMQVALNEESEYDGGRLVFATGDG